MPNVTVGYAQDDDQSVAPPVVGWGNARWGSGGPERYYQVRATDAPYGGRRNN